jgi:hypothetical protein
VYGSGNLESRLMSIDSKTPAKVTTSGDRGLCQSFRYKVPIMHRDSAENKSEEEEEDKAGHSCSKSSDAEDIEVTITFEILIDTLHQGLV